MLPGVPTQAEAVGGGPEDRRSDRRPVDGSPAPRDAATVVLLRDGAAGVEAYLLTRVSRMTAFGGATVFPGGSVDHTDLTAGVGAMDAPETTAPEAAPWWGPDPADWPLGAGPELARALVCAAIRETFEETGVLLAGRPDHAGVEGGAGTAAPTPVGLGDPTGPGDDWAADRRAVETHQLGFADLLRRRGLMLRADLLRPWAHWITPEAEPKRFDTRFFVAALPAGQHPGRPASEAERAHWARPADALAALERGELRMVAPTATTLLELSSFPTVAAVFDAAERRTIRPVRPRVVVDPSGLRLEFPPELAEALPEDMRVRLSRLLTPPSAGRRPRSSGPGAAVGEP